MRPIHITLCEFRKISFSALLALGGLFYSSTVSAQSVRTLKMAANFDSQPFLYMEHNGSIIGFEVDLIREIGKIKGFKVTFVPAIFPQVFDQLTSGKIDFIGHVFNDDERKKLYNLTSPHYIDKIKFLTLANREIKNPLTKGLTIATLAFSPMEEEFKNKIEVDYPLLKIKPELTTYLGFKDLFIKKADVLMTTQSNVERLINNPCCIKHHYQVFDIPNKYQQNIAISFLTAKNNKALANDINSGLQELINNGIYKKLRKKYNL